MTYTYDRVGRRETVTDAVGTREFVYNTDDLQLYQEKINPLGGGLYSKTITREYDGPLAGRLSGFSVEGAGYDVGYHYDENDGRLNRITGPGLPAYGAVYGQAANSDLVEHLRYQSDEFTTLAAVQRAYEPNRNLVDFVENKVGATVVSRYDYTNDAIGRRAGVDYSGTAFGQDTANIWGYNARSELTSSRRYLGTYQNPGLEDPIMRRLYEYDNIGNRQTDTTAMLGTSHYCANAVNQYLATSDIDDCPEPATPVQTFQYDDDGNLTQISQPDIMGDRGHTYTWDAENRLVEVVPNTLSMFLSDKVKFTYDYMGRRVRKQRLRYVGTPEWQLQADERYVYDGWNVVLVLDGLNDNAVVRKYSWGLDLSGWSGDASSSGIHGAGGIGGLLAAVETSGPHAGSYWYLYDAKSNQRGHH